MTADAVLREEIKQAASNAVHGHPVRPAPLLGVWECVCGEPIQPISLAAARVADAVLSIVARVEQEAYRRGQAEAWERGYMFAFAQERGDYTRSRPVPDYIAEDIRSWNPYITEETP